MTPAEQVKERIASLEKALLEQHPSMPSLLQQIHRQLKEDKDVVTVLTEEEISVLVSGLKRQTNTEIAASVMKVSKKKMNNLTLDDI